MDINALDVLDVLCCKITNGLFKNTGFSIHFDTKKFDIQIGKIKKDCLYNRIIAQTTQNSSSQNYSFNLLRLTFESGNLHYFYPTTVIYRNLEVNDQS